MTNEEVNKMDDYKNVTGTVLSTRDGEVCHDFITSLLLFLRDHVSLDLADLTDRVQRRLHVIIDAGGTVYTHAQYQRLELSRGGSCLVQNRRARPWSVVYPPGTHGPEQPKPEDAWNIYSGDYSFDDLLQLDRQLLDFGVLLPEEEAAETEEVDAAERIGQILQQFDIAKSTVSDAAAWAKRTGDNLQQLQEHIDAWKASQEPFPSASTLLHGLARREITFDTLISWAPLSTVLDAHDQLHQMIQTDLVQFLNETFASPIEKEVCGVEINFRTRYDSKCNELDYLVDVTVVPWPPAEGDAPHCFTREYYIDLAEVRSVPGFARYIAQSISDSCDSPETAFDARSAPWETRVDLGDVTKSQWVTLGRAGAKALTNFAADYEYHHKSDS